VSEKFDLFSNWAVIGSLWLCQWL